MDVKEFRALGFLQEVNRRILHPYGLAFSVEIDDDGNESFGEIWDYRDDPEGIYYHASLDLKTRADQLEKLAQDRRAAREESLGYWIQPVD